MPLIRLASGRMGIRPAPLLVLGGAAWTVLVAAAPVLAWPLVYTAAHLVCHQIPERSVLVGAAPMAVCARCLGLYVAAVAGGSAAMAHGGTLSVPARRARALVGAAAVPTLVTVLAEWVLGWPIGNAPRFIAALPLGAAVAWVVVRALEVDWRA